MPRISQFYGIAIYMYFRDHSPPHFHAIYGEFEAEIEIGSSEITDGGLPRNARGLVREWTDAHRDELRRDWDLARAGQPLVPIEPLQ
ncbi:MAG TPA: DUF4160 domain-containing protein [Pirellulales bacterium]|jgi:hypothetical protein|nr:DUF4160 domain-containing protein [Pirellulales bacterium]